MSAYELPILVLCILYGLFLVATKATDRKTLILLKLPPIAIVIIMVFYIFLT